MDIDKKKELVKQLRKKASEFEIGQGMVVLLERAAEVIEEEIPCKHQAATPFGFGWMRCDDCGAEWYD